MDFLPAVPLSRSPNALVVAENVSGLEPSPLPAEDFSTSRSDGPDAGRAPLVVAGCLIGSSRALMGVAGGALLITTIELLYGVDIRLAGSLSLPTMLVAFARYSRDDSFVALRANVRFVAVTAAGSVVGTVLGMLLLGVGPGSHPDPAAGASSPGVSGQGVAFPLTGAF